MKPSSVLAAVLLLAVLAGAVLPSAGCGTDYQDRYVEIVNAFEKQVAKDDVKSTELANGNDLSGLIKLNGQRVSGMEKVMEDLLALEPPAELRRIHVETLYYLLALMDQLRAQNDYYEALLSGKPSDDLKTIAENASVRSRGVGSELAIDLQKANIEVQSAPSDTGSSSPGQSAPNGASAP